MFWVEIQKQPLLKENGTIPTAEQEETGINFISSHVNFPNRGNDIWDARWLRYEKKIASGSFSDL